MIKVICFNKKIDLEDISKHLHLKLGVKCHADNMDDIVNGALYGNYYPIDYQGICLGGHDLKEINEEHLTVVVELYESIEMPKLEHKSTFEPKIVKDDDLDVELDKFAGKKKVKLTKVKNHAIVIEHISMKELIK